MNTENIFTEKTKAHFTDSYFLNPTNPITLNLIGAGGTGSQVLTALARINFALNELDHAGFSVRLWDDDFVSSANLGRQLFAESELGLPKSVALINRVNRFFGTDWKAETTKFEMREEGKLPKNAVANIYISCVDKVSARFGIADLLKNLEGIGYHSNRPYYWMDFGNSRDSGQVILSTVGKIRQPQSEKFETVESLPFVTDEFRQLLKVSETQDDTPSCSLAEALERQDLFINSTLAQMGCSLPWSLFRNGLTENREFFLNLKNFQSQPLKL